MKKLIVLALVMGIASMASAGLVFKVNGVATADGADVVAGDVLSMDFSGPQTSYTITINGTGDATMDTTGVSFAGGFLFGNGFSVGAGQAAAISVRMSGDNFMSPIQPSPVWNTIVVGGTSGTLAIADLGGAGADSLSLNVVPEPMTLGLLGLGGLFLRRRK